MNKIQTSEPGLPLPITTPDSCPVCPPMSALPAYTQHLEFPSHAPHFTHMFSPHIQCFSPFIFLANSYYALKTLLRRPLFCEAMNLQS